jgi:cation diffusion facilitator CzcD-associated flavoprotein CzcO
MGSMPAQDMPLNFIIIGAGIGGLAAALALRREGHRVSVRQFIISSKITHADCVVAT